MPPNVRTFNFPMEQSLGTLYLVELDKLVEAYLEHNRYYVGWEPGLPPLWQYVQAGEARGTRHVPVLEGQILLLSLSSSFPDSNVDTHVGKIEGIDFVCNIESEDQLKILPVVLPNVRGILFAHDAQIVNGLFDCLEQFQQLTHLFFDRLCAHHIDDNESKRLIALRNLKMLAVPLRTFLTAIPEIEGLSRLETLALDFGEYSDKGISDQVTQSLMKVLRKLPLRQLSLKRDGWGRLEATGFAEILSLTNLNYLSLPRLWLGAETCYKDLQKFHNLQTLKFYSTYINDETMQFLKNMRGLRTLEIHGYEFGKCGEFISRTLPTLVELQEFAICFERQTERLNDPFLKAVSNLKNLKSLTVTRGTFMGDGIASLSKLHKLRKLSLRKSEVLAGWSTHSLEPIGKLTQLEELDIREVPLENWDALKQLQHLKILKAGPCAVDVIGPWLRKLTRLETLVLLGGGDRTLSKEQILLVSNLSSLRYLMIGDKIDFYRDKREFGSLLKLRNLQLMGFQSWSDIADGIKQYLGKLLSIFRAI